MKKIFFIIIAICYVFIIFLFSAQPASQSSSESKGIAAKIYETAVVKIDKAHVISKEAFINRAEPIIRKTAHFANFFILAFLICLSVDCFNKPNRYSAALVFCICVIIAILDELHQLFVDGRACRFTDVIIDSGGAAFGMTIFNLYKKIIGRISLWKRVKKGNVK